MLFEMSCEWLLGLLVFKSVPSTINSRMDLPNCPKKALLSLDEEYMYLDTCSKYFSEPRCITTGAREYQHRCGWWCPELSDLHTPSERMPTYRLAWWYLSTARSTER